MPSKGLRLEGAVLYDGRSLDAGAWSRNDYPPIKERARMPALLER
ncbi:MAG: hypothetical protein ABIS07_00445 [Dokdonella sp.]